MSRLLIHVEGQTEEAFVNEVLRGHLIANGFTSVSARIVGNARVRHRRGGIRPWPSVRKDIITHLREDRACIASTMVDFYALPQGGSDGWPGRASAAGTPQERATRIEAAILSDVVAAMGHGFDHGRFVPYVVMHEFEALLFSDCDAFCTGIGRPDLAEPLKAVRSEFETPEYIDDSPLTAPSKRIEGCFRRIQAVPWCSRDFVNRTGADSLPMSFV